MMIRRRKGGERGSSGPARVEQHCVLVSLAEETEYEYSGSDEEDENRGDERESR